MALTPGTRLGPYEVTAQIGVGGMGEVYRARDTVLNRDVALKVLPDSFASDPDRLARFTREAQTLAALNHPHIAQVHGLETSGGTRALVMELVEGDDLSVRIARGAIPPDEALPIAKQIAEALEAAHNQGIIHRDLKPANIKVRADGTVKVLDFGLAKLTPGHASGAAVDVTGSPTITSPAMTRAGVILGTAAYMAPEQAKGREADKRSDIWAFGAVLYEMLTATRAFAGEDLSDTLAAVLRAEPDWSRLPEDVPPLIRTLLRQCLEKDPRKRVADAGTLQFALTHSQVLGVGPRPAPAPPAPRSLWRQMAIPAAVVATAAITWGLLTVSQQAPAQSVTRLSLSVPADAPVAYSQTFGSLAVSPDGSSVVYTSAPVSPVTIAVRARLLLRRMDTFEPTVVAEATEAPRMPFFSPDGEWVGFFGIANAGAGNGFLLKRVPAAGGPSVTIATLDGQPGGAAWITSDAIVFATNSATTGLQQVSTSGGEPKVLTRPDVAKGELDHVWPHMLPGGNAVLFTIIKQPIEQSMIAVLDLRDGTQKVVLNGGSDARYVPSGHLVYGSGSTLRGVGFDLGRLEVQGAPVPLVERVVISGGGAANVAVSADGTLTYVSGSQGEVPPRALVWVDRAGREQPIAAPPREYVAAQLSADDRRIVLTAQDEQDDIWIWDLARETLQRLTFDAGINRGGLWTPDGARVAFTRPGGSSESEIYWQPADGSGMAEPLTAASPRPFIPSDITADGKALIVHHLQTPLDVGIVDIGSSPSTVRPLVATGALEQNGTISPDGRWLAYQSNGSGRDEIYVRPFPAVESGLWQVSTTGGRRPHWSRDGRELFYVGLADSSSVPMMAASVTPGPSFAAGSPTKLFEGPYVLFNSRLSYDVSADGKRFLMMKTSEEAKNAAPPQIIVVQHWVEELKRLVPVN